MERGTFRAGPGSLRSRSRAVFIRADGISFTTVQLLDDSLCQISCNYGLPDHGRSCLGTLTRTLLIFILIKIKKYPKPFQSCSQ